MKTQGKFLYIGGSQSLRVFVRGTEIRRDRCSACDTHVSAKDFTWKPGDYCTGSHFSTAFFTIEQLMLSYAKWATFDFLSQTSFEADSFQENKNPILTDATCTCFLVGKTLVIISGGSTEFIGVVRPVYVLNLFPKKK